MSSDDDVVDAAEFEAYYTLMNAGWKTYGRSDLPRSWARLWFEWEKANGSVDGGGRDV